MNDALSEDLRDHLGYGPSTGVPALRKAIARHLGLTRAVRCAPEQVIVITGPLQGVETVVRVLLTPGDGGQTWPPELLLLQLMHLCPDAQGLDVARGRVLAPDASLVYLHPLAQFPTGIRTTATRGAELLQWAEDSGAWILEGCYNDELVHIHPVPPALQQRDRHGRGPDARGRFPCASPTWCSAGRRPRASVGDTTRPAAGAGGLIDQGTSRVTCGGCAGCAANAARPWPTPWGATCPPTCGWARPTPDCTHCCTCHHRMWTASWSAGCTAAVSASRMCLRAAGR
jgi:hypothetical protein